MSDNSAKSQRDNRFNLWKLLPPAVAVLGVLVSFYGWQSAEDYTRDRNAEYFQTLVSDTQQALDMRFALYMQSLWGATGLFAASDEVSQEEWSTYVSALNIEERLPGILGIDYVAYVAKQDMEQFLQDIPPAQMEKFSNFPDTGYSDRFIIRYVGSIDDSGEVLGTDIGFEETRRAAAERARDTGTPVVTDIIQRQIASAQGEASPSFLLLIPVYDGGGVPATLEERRRTIRGWVDAPFVGASLLSDLQEVSRNQVAFSVYDGTTPSPEQRIFRHQDFDAEAPDAAFSIQTTYEIAGQVWTILWHSTDAFRAPSNVSTPAYLLTFGLFSTLLLASLLQLLVRQNLIIAQRVRERTSELREAKLQAERADAMKSDFLANMSHELRTPLNGVIGTADLLMNTELSERQYEFANIISRSGESLLLLINDILDISKIEAGELEINPERFVLRHMLKDAIQPQLSKANQYGAELNVDYDPDLPYGIIGDPLRISQVVINLVGNAIKFAERGAVTVRVSHQETAGDATLLRFEVEDSGIGIAPDRVAEIFGKFSQADAKITRKYGGTGLGLAISKNLVELMDGEIGVQSELGKGSTFWFSIPVEIAQREPPEYQSADMETIGNKKVLVIEPSPITRKIIQGYLAHMEIPHRMTATLDEGRLQMQEQSFDACVLSVELGEEDIQKFMEQTKAEGRDKLHFVLITSVHSIPEMSAIRASGFSSFILKPVYPDDLIEALMRSSGLESFRKQVRSRRRTNIEDTRILLVEDDPVNQQVAGRMLEELGYTADVAKNGIVALKMAAKESYDLALMDIMMPEMDGYTTTRKLREMQEQGEITSFPIIALTANAMKEQIDKCIEAGMDDFLTKPVRQRMLEEKLEHWLSSQAPEPEPAIGDAKPSQDQSGIDWEQLEDLRAVMKDGYADFISESLENITRLVENLQTGIAEEDQGAIYQASHSLISNCSYLGISRASQLAREIETLAHPESAAAAQNMQEIRSLETKLVSVIERAKPALMGAAT